MSSSQETIVSLYAWTAAIVVILSVFILLKMILLPFFHKFFESQYSPVGKDQGIPFSQVKQRQEVEGYIPNMKETGFSYPLLAFSETEKIDADLFDWKGHEEHPETSVASDINEVLNGAEPEHTVLSPVRYWSYNVNSFGTGRNNDRYHKRSERSLKQLSTRSIADLDSKAKAQAQHR